MLAWIAVVAIVAPFWVEHRHVPHLLAAGLAPHLFAIAIICTSVVQILLIGRAFYTAPVVTMRRRLAESHRFRVVSSLALGLGVACMVVSVLLARRLANRAPSSRFLRRMIDDLAGHSPLRATRQLEEIVGFERG